jgi:hypothetical protein
MVKRIRCWATDLIVGAALTGCLACPSVASETTIFTYDALGRLTASATGGTVNNGVSTAVVFDSAGNRSSYSVSGVPVTPSFSIGSATAIEGALLSFTITRSGSLLGSSSVSYLTSDGTAVSGADYIAASGVMTFAAGEASKIINIATVDDAVVEPVETMTVTLFSPTGGAVLDVATGTGTIIDNDQPPPTFAINDASATEGGALVFTVTKSGSTTLPYSINFSSGDGTALAGSDYVASSGTLTFLAGDTAKTFSIATIDDTVVESTENMSVNLFSPTGGAAISRVSGVGTIFDNDVAPPPTPLNPVINVTSESSVSMGIAILATTSVPARITAMTPPASSGSAAINPDGQSVVYTAPRLARPNLCEPAYTVTFAIPYSIQNASGGTQASGSVTMKVKSLPGLRPTPPQVCP